MSAEIEISTTDGQGRVFLTWTPVKASARLLAPAAAPVRVTLSNAGAAGGGLVTFYAGPAVPGVDHLQVDLPADGSPVDFWVSGTFGHPSLDYGDAVISMSAGDPAPLATCDLMVRIRKDAIKLSDAERDRFLVAMGKLNDAGKGPFKAFREMHVQASISEAHGGAAFPPWHRSYLLDLERDLQAVDSSVALPYWRFDVPAPALFAPEFLGMPPASQSAGDFVQFPPNHPLLFWKTDNVTGIPRRPWYDIQQAPPTVFQGGPWVISEHDTLALSDQYAAFRGMESAPHGMAHVSFTGPISKIPTAARDPLFFLLHANVDRLWAKWQWFYKRRDPTVAATFSPSPRIGHRLNDTMWPWNGSTTPPRPTFPPPGGGMAASVLTPLPGTAPTVRSMIDYQGINGGDALGFDYDDVPFER
ncbi:MAG TPA: tyrosinase family protein [Phenylobacterium sp.]|jgi:tyrosinase|uniref:tyrosinase family protein n=1 Tax=Phenylobacterium sp. TaxID=1871053 RepID=UPI002CFCFF45|nr:tyrosinase family protein [Phenylobacterium sp.]HXA37573.1 tyrosinase family protein [Phenylobacterium sp.]